MKIEKLAETKLKIMFDITELEENNISLHSFLSNSIEAQRFFLAILEIANEDLDFNSYNASISYEAFSFENKSFVIFITKEQKSNLKRDSHLNLNNNFFSVLKDDKLSKNNRFFFLDNKLSKDKKSLIYIFPSIEELFDFCKILKNSLIPFNLDSNLYQYNHIYFLEIKINSSDILNNNYLEKLELICSDIKNDINFSENVKIRLKEFSSLLLEKNAISILG